MQKNITKKFFGTCCLFIVTSLGCDFSFYNKGFSQSKGPKITKPKYKLTPEVRKSFKEANENFNKCKANAVEQVKTKAIDQAQFQSSLKVCQEKFPSADLHAKCKQRVLKGPKNEIKNGLKICKQLLAAATFSPDDFTPFLMHRDKLYFAGIGMNEALHSEALQPPNFDCGKLNETKSQMDSAEYLLFGNHPSLFSQLQIKKMDTAIKKAKATDQGVLVKGLGRYFGGVPSTDDEGNLYFPSSSCAFDGQLGDNFSGLTSYFLIDEKKDKFYPYFSIAFFSADAPVQEISKKSIENKMLKILGAGYQAVHESDSAVYLAEEAISDFDSEGDPRNVCQSQKKYNYIGILKKDGSKANQIKYILVANIKSLCAFAEEVSQRY